MNTFWQDLRFGARMLLKNPGFTLVAVIRRGHAGVLHPGAAGCEG